MSFNIGLLGERGGLGAEALDRLGRVVRLGRTGSG
jgi:hypothetical protein